LPPPPSCPTLGTSQKQATPVRVLGSYSTLRTKARTTIRFCSTVPTCGNCVNRRASRIASIAVTERLIWTLKHEWLARVVPIRGLGHLGDLLGDFEVYYNQHRCHQRLGGATPAMIYGGGNWQKPDRLAKTLRCPIRLRHFREQRITTYGLAS
jgi:hypothetical protein